MEHDPRASMTEWLQKFLSLYRAEAGELSGEEGVNISNLDDFSPPCQVHLFWFRAEPNIDYSCLLQTKMKNSPDGLVEVVGPMHPSEAIGVLSEVLNWDRWSEEVEDPGYFLFEGEDRSIRMAVANAMIQAKQRLDQHILRCAYAKELFSGRPMGKQIFPGDGFTWDIYGDLRDEDPSDIIDEIRQGVIRLGGSEPSPRTADRNLALAFGTYFYPQIWVGDLPEQTPHEILQGSLPAELLKRTKAVDTEYKGHKVVVNHDGYIAIVAGSKPEATVLLNEIMATAWLCGIDTTTIREAEVGRARINVDDSTVVSQGSQLVSLRTASAFGIPWSLNDSDVRFRDQITESDLLQVISEAESLNSDKYTQNILSFLLEAHTHQVAQEFRQSLVMTWLVVESWVNKTWSETLDVQEVSGQRRERLSNNNSYTAAIKSDTLNLLGRIGDQQLAQLTSIRRLRNSVVHDGHVPNQQEAEEAMEFATEILQSGLVGGRFAGQK